MPLPEATLDRGGVQLTLRQVAKDCGLKKITPHSLRHSYATHLTSHTNDAASERINALMHRFSIQWGTVK